MPAAERSSPRRIDILIAIGCVVIVVLQVRRNSRSIDTHQPGVSRIETFELQPGEVSVAVRVTHRGQAAAHTGVWSCLDDGDEVEGKHTRAGMTDVAGIVQVPVRKDNSSPIYVFARDQAGRVGACALSGERLLSNSDVHLLDVEPRRGRLTSDNGSPIPGTVLTVTNFNRLGPQVGGSSIIPIPAALRRDYTVTTDSDGRFVLPRVPLGGSCQLLFRTADHGEAHFSASRC